MADQRISLLHARIASLFLLAAVLLAGCGGGAETTGNSPAGSAAVGTAQTYTGPPPATDDVQAFRLSVWDNLNAINRCGECHVANGQAPTFVRGDDVNAAYAEALTIVDLATPANSRMVTKVAGGHNCWLASDQACADTIISYITAWAGGTTGSGNVIKLVAPATLSDPGDSKTFPADSSAFAAIIHPLLTAHCANCHTDTADNAQSPFFANSDPDSAYEYARSKIDLDNPANSRFVVRLRDEFHNCWDPDNTGSSDCAASAARMEAGIAEYAATIEPTMVDPSLVTSKAMTLFDGILASGGSRHESDVIALYQFKTGSGNVAYDTSGIPPEMHLTLSGGVDWVGGYGIDITNGKAQATTTGSRKLHTHIQSTGEYSIEAWVVPANVSQEGPARIVSYSANTMERNFTMGQTLYSYDFLHRSSSTDANGQQALSTADADEDLQATLQHVVMTFDPVNGRRIYVNGEFTGDNDPVAAGNLSEWNSGYAFVLGNEVSGDRQWQGKLRLVAVHKKALTPEQIAQNYAAGVGEKYFLLFNVEQHTGVADSYILFEVSQFDNYSYLFNQPVFISLDPDAVPDGIPLAGMRIGINGREVSVGQAWRNLDTVISSSAYSPDSGQLLSPLGSVFALEKGPDADEFFLTFELLGSSTNVVLEPVPLPPASPPDLPEQSLIGLRNFDEIDATMAAVTGVSRQQVDVENVYRTVRQQLPPVETIEGFVSAQQMAVSQLAIEYCSALVDNQGDIAREVYFPGFFTEGLPPETAGSAFDSAGKRDQVIQPLLDNIMNTGLTVQPDPSGVTGELDDLILLLSGCAVGPSPQCDTAVRTEQIVKAVCAATLGSAAMLIQ